MLWHEDNRTSEVDLAIILLEKDGIDILKSCKLTVSWKECNSDHMLTCRIESAPKSALHLSISDHMWIALSML